MRSAAATFVTTILPGALGVLLAAAGMVGCKRQPSAPPRPPLPDRSLADVWAIGDGDELERDATDAPATSPVWDGRRVKLFAGGNEIVAFQLIVRAGKPGIRQLRAALPSLSGPGDRPLVHRPPPDDPSDYRDRDIAIHALHYLKVDQATRADHIYNPDGPDAPADPLGWKPVQLIPENARSGSGGFPLAVAPGDNQALWFEIYTGRQRPPGVYRGAIAITADGARIDVPIELELLDFALPDRNSLTAMVYYERDQLQLYQGQTQQPEWAATLEARYHRFAHRQRIELVNAYDIPAVQAALGRFDGRDFTVGNGYQGPGEGTGNRVVPATFYGPGDGWLDQPGRARADAWMTFVKQALPDAITFLYLPDEPSEGQFPEIQSFTRALRGNPGPGGKLPTLVTHQPAPGLAGAVDIWCATPAHFDPARVAQERAAGRQVWFYNGGRPQAPALVIDAPASDPRVIGWMAFKAGVPVYFYWHAMHWQHNSQKKLGDRRQNVWVDPITFDLRRADGRGDFANGDGVLLYPGTDVLHPDQDRGIAGPISTLQLANLRRGLQDHLYLTLARQRGHQALVDELLGVIVPRVFAGASGPVSFPQSSAPFEQARLRLARALTTKSAALHQP